MSEVKQSTRIQTSLLNGVEKKALIWLANHLPAWVSSDMMTWFGVFGAFLVGLGFVLTYFNIYWLWLSVGGLFIHWFGDSLDGRQRQALRLRCALRALLPRVAQPRIARARCIDNRQSSAGIPSGLLDGPCGIVQGAVPVETGYPPRAQGNRRRAEGVLRADGRMGVGQLER